MGDRWDACRLRHRGAAPPPARAAGHRDFGHQLRRKPRRERVLLRHGGSGARSRVAPHPCGRDVAVLEKIRRRFQTVGAHRTHGGRACVERKAARSSAAQHQRARTLDRRRPLHAPVKKDHAQSTERRQRPARTIVFLAFRAAHQFRRREGLRLRSDFRRRRVDHAAAPRPH